MGIFNKFIEIFSDPIEEDETEEIKVDTEEIVKETKAVEPVISRPVEHSPKMVEPKEEKARPIYDVSKDTELYTNKEEERGLYQSKDTFKFPVFDEDEIETTLSRKREVKTEVNTEPTRISRSSVSPINIEKPKGGIERKEVKPVEEKKVFRPSPVISPIYGILDKNYTKDDVIEKKEEIKTAQASVDFENTTAVSYDVVRRKAYGTLEDELEDTLSSSFKKDELKETKKEEIKEVQEDIKNLEDPKKHIEKLLDELEKTASMTVGEIEEALKNELEDTDEYDLPDTLIKGIEEKPKNKVEDELEKTEEFKPKDIKQEVEENDDEDLENDLFNLIDSMYEDGDDK